VGPRKIHIKKGDLETTIRPAQVKPEELTIGLPPTQAELARRQSLVAQILAKRQQRVITPLTTADLANNVKCGNSLIGPDFYENQQMSFLDEEERYRINVFDWKAEFPEIMKAGGFDVVIGNPPYGAMITQAEAQYLHTEFEATNKDPDTYSLFVEQAIRLCKPLGKVSMIVPTGWYSGAKFGALRRFIACTTDPESFVNLPYDVFKAWVDTTIFVVTKRSNLTTWPRPVACTVRLRTFPKRHRITSAAEFEVGVRSAAFTEWFANGRGGY
jgi:hypothetical protein